jgi:hypothetical protein
MRRLLSCVWLMAGLVNAAPPYVLSSAHTAAAGRTRRIVVQLDAADHRRLQLPPEEWLRYIFTFPDQPGSQIDSILLDIGLDTDSAVYPSNVLPPTPDRVIREWNAHGFEWVGALVRECRKRNLEVFWDHRFSEVDLNAEGKLEMETLHPMKAAHPDWLIRSWWWQGLWNVAVPEVRQMKVRLLRELVENYALDGIQIDFARHVPALPPGRQWENREGATEFLRMLRSMLMGVEKAQGRAILLGVKVPHNVAGAHADGFDVETWGKEHLVDRLTLGSRSMDVDVEGYRRATAGSGIKLMPCFDDHHATDGYRFGSIEFLRGVFSSWWQQGADGVTTFNWGVAPPEIAAKMGDAVVSPSHSAGYQEIGSALTLRGKDKLFAVERRGGYPWAEGVFNRNDTAALPHLLPNDERISNFMIRIADNPGDLATAETNLHLVLFRAGAGDQLEVKFNDVRLSESQAEAEWKDPQIFSPDPQPASGGSGVYKINPKQKLLRLSYRLDPRWLRQGANDVQVRVKRRTSYPPATNIQLEKLEVTVAYSRHSGKH